MNVSINIKQAMPHGEADFIDHSWAKSIVSTNSTEIRKQRELFSINLIIYISFPRTEPDIYSQTEIQLMEEESTDNLIFTIKLMMENSHTNVRRYSGKRTIAANRYKKWLEID